MHNKGEEVAKRYAMQNNSPNLKIVDNWLGVLEELGQHGVGLELLVLESDACLPHLPPPWLEVRAAQDGLDLDPSLLRTLVQITHDVHLKLDNRG